MSIRSDEYGGNVVVFDQQGCLCFQPPFLLNLGSVAGCDVTPSSPRKSCLPHRTCPHKVFVP